jgi:hypothetical protein
LKVSNLVCFGFYMGAAMMENGGDMAGDGSMSSTVKI